MSAPLPGLAVRAVSCVEADEGTADCALFCRCDDGSDYAVKDASKYPHLPHTEWFCTRVGERVGLASPVCAVVNVKNLPCFGSRWETGHDPDDWWVKAHSGEIEFDLVAPTISRILAFDLFVHNDDRHLHNYIIRRQRMGHAVLAFDYSRAWLHHGFPLPDGPIGPGSNTIRAYRFLNNLFPGFLRIQDVEHVFERLGELSAVAIETIISEHPASWLTAERSDAILDWWDSPRRLARISSVKEGILDGSYL